MIATTQQPNSCAHSRGLTAALQSVEPLLLLRCCSHQVVRPVEQVDHSVHLEADLQMTRQRYAFQQWISWKRRMQLLA